MLLPSYLNAGQNLDIETANKQFETVAQFKYLRATISNRNFIYEKIQRRLNSSSICYH
jgi:hypothetical protein